MGAQRKDQWEVQRKVNLRYKKSNRSEIIEIRNKFSVIKIDEVIIPSEEI